MADFLNSKLPRNMKTGMCRLEIFEVVGEALFAIDACKKLSLNSIMYLGFEGFFSVVFEVYQPGGPEPGPSRPLPPSPRRVLRC